MDNKQSSKFKMYQAVAKVCQTNATDIATNPAFKAEADEFVALIPEIRRVNGLIGDDLKPVAITKNQAKDAMVESALDMAKNIKAVGLINKDENLKSIGCHQIGSFGWKRRRYFTTLSTHCQEGAHDFTRFE